MIGFSIPRKFIMHVMIPGGTDFHNNNNYVFDFIVILHSNDLVRMLKYNMLDHHSKLIMVSWLHARSVGSVQGL